MKPEVIKIKTYIEAKHQMSLDNLRTAVVIQERRVKASAQEVEYHTAVLAGYTQALLEKQEGR